VTPAEAMAACMARGHAQQIPGNTASVLRYELTPVEAVAPVMPAEAMAACMARGRAQQIPGNTASVRGSVRRAVAVECGTRQCCH